jgi:hypothetical protein
MCPVAAHQPSGSKIIEMGQDAMRLAMAKTREVVRAAMELTV